MQKAKELKKDDGTRLDAGNTVNWALVTGANEIIGCTIAIALARRNIPVVLVARDVKKLEHLSRLIKMCSVIYWLCLFVFSTSVGFASASFFFLKGYFLSGTGSKPVGRVASFRACDYSDTSLIKWRVHSGH